jgi:hypothetical protein
MQSLGVLIVGDVDEESVGTLTSDAPLIFKL